MEFYKELKTTARYTSILSKNWINSTRDLLQYFPRTYENRESIMTLDQINLQDKSIVCSVKWLITDKWFFQKWRLKIYDIKFQDELWNLGKIAIYNASYLASKIEKDKRYIITWKPAYKFWRIVFTNPEVSPSEFTELQNNMSEWWIFPIYSEMNGIKPNWFANKMRLVLPEIKNLFAEYLPAEFLQKFGLMWIQDTFKQIHYPDNVDKLWQAKYRVFFDKLLRVQLHSLLMRKEYQDWTTFNTERQVDRAIIKDIVSKLDFQLTNAQKKALKTIIENLHEEKPMMRLLQWDVWSGKTVVAAIAAYYTFKKFWAQSVFLAPLEVLADQHYKNLAKLLLPLWMRIEILKWSLTKQQKDKVKQDLKDWKINLLVWTHAVIQDDVVFKDLMYVVIDEQHKFWVKQRSAFNKFGSPHILQMSATPIPRSMALAFFGEFDVSVIDELPAWRKEINTKIISENEFLKLKTRILTKIAQKQKVFIVTPLIEESDKMEDLKSAIAEFENVKQLFPWLSNRIWLLHGKMKPAEKDEVMKWFKWDKFDILVSTTVIEVWVDVPEATIMVIKNAERFWLSQLHQLRWRIWRNSLQSYCFLETKKKSWEVMKRLEAMEQTNDWFKLAELDLKTRWAGEILGTMQSWETDIPLEILSDMRFIEKVREWAERLLQKYPNLDWLDWLQRYLNEKIGNVLA